MIDSESWKNKIETEKVKSENIVGFVKTFNRYHQKFYFGRFFSTPVKL